MLIVSWNVAGLKPALQKIHNDYGSNGGEAKSKSAAKSSTPPSHPFANYLRLHGDVDILCLQVSCSFSVWLIYICDLGQFMGDNFTLADYVSAEYQPLPPLLFSTRNTKFH